MVSSRSNDTGAKKDLGITPSEWMKDYCEWNTFSLESQRLKATRYFPVWRRYTSHNDTGKLVARLQKEFEGDERVEVEPFSPLVLQYGSGVTR
jgi:hypothetical protein